MLKDGCCQEGSDVIDGSTAVKFKLNKVSKWNRIWERKTHRLFTHMLFQHFILISNDV